MLPNFAPQNRLRCKLVCTTNHSIEPPRVLLQQVKFTQLAGFFDIDTPDHSTDEIYQSLAASIAGVKHPYICLFNFLCTMAYNSAIERLLLSSQRPGAGGQVFWSDNTFLAFIFSG